MTAPGPGHAAPAGAPTTATASASSGAAARREWRVPAVAGAIAFVVYAATMCPTIPPGDGGELLTCAYTLGVPHPPGYPVYTLVGWLWSHLLPFGSVAWRMNLLSVVAMAGAVALIARAAGRLGATAPAALGAALAFAFAFDPWRAAVGAEVFGPHALLTAAILERALAWPDSGRPPYAAALLLGIAGAHHQTALFLAFALTAWILAILYAHFVFRRPAPASFAPFACAGLVCLGLSAYLWLLFFGRGDRALAWGDTRHLFAAVDGARLAGEPLTTGGLFPHILRADYGSLRLGSEQGGGLAAAGVEVRLAWVWRWIADGLGGLWLAGLVLAPLGAWAAWRADWPSRRAAILLVAAVAFGGGAYNLLVNFPPDDILRRAVVARFYVMPAIPIALLAALGLQAVATRLGRPAAWALAAAAVLGSAIPASGLLGGTPAGYSGVRAVEAFGRHILASAPERALVFIVGDVPTNACDVLWRAEGLRPDVTPVNQQKLNYVWGAREARRMGINFPGRRYDGQQVNNLRLFMANEGDRPLYVFGTQAPDESYAERYRRIPHGLLERMAPRTEPVDLDRVYADNTALLDAFDWPAVTATRPDPYFLDEVRDQHAAVFVRLGALFQLGPDRDGKGERRPLLAAKVYERGLALFPDHATLHLNHAILCRNDLGRPEDAKRHATRFYELKPDDPTAIQMAVEMGLIPPRARESGRPDSR